MDSNTPERTQIGTHKAKFEDSPIFNYINTLSPIKPVKSTHLTQSLNSLSFASIPSVFTSSHLSAHKNSSFLRRHHMSNPSKPLVSSDQNGVDRNEESLHANKIRENASSFVPPNEHLKLVTLPQTLRYDCGSRGRNSTSHCGIAAGSVLPLADSSTRLGPYNLIVSEKGVHVGEADLSGSCLPEQKKGAIKCEWESLTSDNTELVNFYPPHKTTAFKGVIRNSQNQEVNDLDKSQLGDPLHPCETHKTTDPSTQQEEASELNDICQKVCEFDCTSMRLGPTSNPSEATDNEPVTNLQRGVRRRCLVYEMGGPRMKNFMNCSTSISSMPLQPGEEMATIDNQLVSMKSVVKSSQRTLPGIGLHLNALTRTPNNLKVVKHETLTTVDQHDVNNSTRFQPPITGEETVNIPLVPASSEMYTNFHGNDIQGDEDGLQAPTDIAPENLDLISPKNKRRRFDVGENDGCKRCNCKKSKCLKLYCECFAAGVYCIGSCSCQECFNKPIHEETVLATRKQIELRNPLAFAPKVVRTSDPLPDSRLQDEANQTPASARHKSGCNCKKSSCLKKYCECYQSGVGCSINCRCEGCKNAFGTKDGLGFCIVEMEAKPDEKETKKFEENVVNKDSRIPQIPNKEDQTADSPLPSTPLLISRFATQLPFSSKYKLQRSFTIGPSPGLQYRPKHPLPNFLQPQPKFDNNVPRISKEYYTPVVLQSNSTPISGVKSSSPNSKRVSANPSDIGSSASAGTALPSLKSSRKLILQSIPSFPCLNSQP